jgi:hypothetical protein
MRCSAERLALGLATIRELPLGRQEERLTAYGTNGKKNVVSRPILFARRAIRS